MRHSDITHLHSGAASDTELLGRSREVGMTKRRADTDEEGQSHTVGYSIDIHCKSSQTLRYRRRRGGEWREVNQTDVTRREDEDELQVDVKEEKDAKTAIVTTTYEARWKVLKYEHLPEWLQDNEFLRYSLFTHYCLFISPDMVIVHLCLPSLNASSRFGHCTRRREIFGHI